MAIRAFLLFPGQGAQSVGMAQDVCQAGGRASALFEEASEILGFDLVEMVFRGDAETLARTENCQPALLVASLAVLETLRERGTVEISGAMGLSLGEYTALVALEVMDFSDAVRLVRRRGELMEAAGRDHETGMASIIGLDGDTVAKACEAAAHAGLVVPANYNSPEQVVISGEKAAVEKAGALCKEGGAKRVLPLNVSAAFHSPVMKPAADGLRAALADVPLRAPTARFVNNADAQALEDPEAIRDSLCRQLVGAVRWEQSCRLALGWGERTFLEVGPGRVCQGLMRRIDREAQVTCIGTLEAIEQAVTSA